MKKVSSRYLNSDGEFFVRCSSLGTVMASPTKNELSVGARTYVKNAFKETYLGYEPDFQGDSMSKGIFMEDLAIELVSKIVGEPYVKNEEQRSNGFIKGTCDIEYGDKIRDIKCSHSKKSFPLLPADGKDTKYEWQGRAYMMLWNKDDFYLDYCLMETPDSLIPKYESLDLHKGINDLPDNLRVTTVTYTRDLNKEQQIINRVKLCRVFWNELKETFKIK